MKIDHFDPAIENTIRVYTILGSTRSNSPLSTLHSPLFTPQPPRGGRVRRAAGYGVAVRLGGPQAIADRHRSTDRRGRRGRAKVRAESLWLLIPNHILSYIENTINIKPWKNDNPRDHVLKDCLAIIKQMRHSQDVRQDLPQFVELYNSLID